MKFRFSDSGRVWTPGVRLAWPVHAFALPAMTLRTRLLILAASTLALLVMLAPSVGAQSLPTVDAGIFDGIAQAYQIKAQSWEEGLRAIARSLFYGLAVISIAWTCIKIMLQKDDVKAFIPTMTMQILTLGFFFYLVENGTKIASMVIRSFELSANRVAGTGSLQPSWLVQNGFECVFSIMERIGEMGLGEAVTVALPLMICAIILLMAFVGIGILFLVTLIESYFVLYGGIIVLGFGALPWTREIPKNYLIYAINVGVKLFVLYLVAGIGMEFSRDWPALVRGVEGAAIINVTLYLMSAAVMFLAVAWKVPGIAAALTSGALNFNAGDAMGVTAAAAGVGAAVGAVATGGVSSLAAATQGAMQATTSGMALAKEQGSSGIGAALKGLGHAAGAAASEVGSAAQARMGLKPPSVHSEDQRGRSIENLGTRAANNLQSQVQAEREAKAAAPVGANIAPADAGGVMAAQPSDTPDVSSASPTMVETVGDTRTLGTLTKEASNGWHGPLGGGMDAETMQAHRESHPHLYSKDANGAEKLQPWDPASGMAHKYDQSGFYIEDQSKWGHRDGSALAGSTRATPSVQATPAATGAAQSSPAPVSAGTSFNASPESTPPDDESVSHTDAKSEGRLKPPTLPPPDTAQGGVSINLGTTDD